MSLDHEYRNLPLAAIRAFEAAARLGSFTGAGRELGLTQSAISRHIRALEDSFSVPLFRRQGRAVTLTPAGDAFFRPVNEGMRLIRLASIEMRRRKAVPNRLTISLLPSVAALWLAPRLADFTARNPAIELRVHASRSLVDFGIEEVDVGIRYGLGDWPDVRAHHLAAETLTPVCSPEFASRHRLDLGPEALLGVPLLSDDIVDDWSQWFEAAGVGEKPRSRGAQLNDSASLYLAAASGLGVALGRSFLVERALQDGQLIAPFPLAIPATYAYWLVFPSRGKSTPATRLFTRWVQAQIAGEQGSDDR